ncbi:hypothetical protein [Bacillus horti]|uniref:Uncharacterized protein (UPF0332 family) n=1 Tax=Caldalkalibacillus horti TaxID=77523 RepID=A0ABT9VTM1_9BACI|nr:hypothetical protein [Bacillus horti]MDQ0164331.1 uncharacterized protein (UPF0332 family) [Bacillus horti]
MSTRYVRKSLNKSRDFLKTGKEELRNDSINSGVSALYYAAFQAVCAVVLSDGTPNTSGIVTEKQVLDYLEERSNSDLFAFYKNLMYLKHNASTNLQEVLPLNEAMSLSERVEKFIQAIDIHSDAAAAKEFTLFEEKKVDINRTEETNREPVQPLNTPVLKKGSTIEEAISSLRSPVKYQFKEVTVEEALINIHMETENREAFHLGVIQKNSFLTSVPVSPNHFEKLLNGNISFVFIPNLVGEFIEVVEASESSIGKAAQFTGRMITAKVVDTEPFKDNDYIVATISPVIFNAE